jgi:hypothetical protein
LYKLVCDKKDFECRHIIENSGCEDFSIKQMEEHCKLYKHNYTIMIEKKR